jgi:outer membrane protein OmpA-like peptidoglycan-associated protein/Mg-chelatase subunit ChlD
MKKLFALLLLAVTGCASFKGEPAAELDPIPPLGYTPVYVKNSAPIASSPDKKPAFYMSRIESETNRTKLFVHIVDSNGNYLFGAAKNKSIWCTLLDEVGGKPTQIKDFKLKEVIEADRTPTAIALVMDHSGSMGEERAKIVQEAAEYFLNMKKSEDAVALVKYDNRTVVESSLLQDGFMVKNKLQKNGLIGFGGMTAIGDGIAAGIEQVANAKGYDRRAVLVFTDGQDNSSMILKDSIIRLAKRTNTIICCVDFGVNTDKQYLQDVADNCGGTYHNIYSSKEFELVFGDVYKKLKNYYTLEYTPRDYGLHTVSLKLCLPKDTLYAERMYDNTPVVGSYSLVDVNFDVNKADITSASQPAIDNIVVLMKAYPDMTIELRGHTDNTNGTKDPDYNKKLSQRRADAVKDAIVKSGIAAKRITSIGYGESIPIADNTSEEGRAKNRRTEIAIISR